VFAFLGVNRRFSGTGGWARLSVGLPGSWTFRVIKRLTGRETAPVSIEEHCWARLLPPRPLFVPFRSYNLTGLCGGGADRTPTIRSHLLAGLIFLCDERGFFSRSCWGLHYLSDVSGGDFDRMHALASRRFL